MKGIVVCLAVLGLVAACTTDGDEAGTAEPAPQTSEVADAPETSEVAEPPQTSEAVEAPLELGAGVTEDEIAIGVIYIDLESVADLVQLDHGDYRGAYQAVIDDLNARGGINGRTVVPSFASFNPILAADQDAACLELTQDIEVFAVIGAVESNLARCITELNETPLVGGVHTAETLAQARAPWFTGSAADERRLDLIVRAFVERGQFEGTTLAVVAGSPDEAAMSNAVLPVLAEAGIEPVEVVTLSPVSGDEAAFDAEMAVVNERLESLGVDQVLTVGTAVGLFLGGLENGNYRPQVVGTDQGSAQVYLFDATGRDLSVLEGLVVAGEAQQDVWWADDAVQDCIDVIEAATPGLTITNPAEWQAGDPEDLVSTWIACMTVDLFAQITDAAGEELNAATWEAAGESLGETTLVGLGPASFGPDKHDGADAVYFAEWDAEAQRLVGVGEPVVAG